MKPPPTGWNSEFWGKVVNPARLEAEVAAARALYPVQDTTGSSAYDFALMDRTWEAVAKNTGILYNKGRR